MILLGPGRESMQAGWTTTRKIICLNDAGERVVVFRQVNPDPEGSRQRRYVLGNGAPVDVVADSRFRIIETMITLTPMNI